MNDEDAIKYAIHNLNKDAHGLNKHIIQKSATMQDIPIQKQIYKQPQPRHQPPPVTPPQQLYQQPVVQQPQINTDPALLNTLIERVSSVEKQITKFVNLIQKQVARNAKEINIRIKLDNVSTNKE